MTLASSTEPLPAAAGEPREFSCPRCGRAATERFYGPCGECRDQLAATLGTEPQASQPERVAYEPKANVTPNFVATKE